MRRSGAMLKNCWPATSSNTGSRFASLPFNAAYRARTLSFVGSNTQSRRRITVSGKITFPSSDG